MVVFRQKEFSKFDTLDKIFQTAIPRVCLELMKCIEMYEFLGKLMGISIRSQTPLIVNLADIFWKRLVGIEITIEDVLSLDLEFSTVSF